LEFTVRDGCTVTVAEHQGKVFAGGDKVDIPLARALEQPHVFEETFADTPPDLRAVLTDAGVVKAKEFKGGSK
jgi:hypothetical protein